MAAKSVVKDSIILSEGHPLDAINVIASGSVIASFPGGEIVLKKGDAIGISDISFDSSFFTYKVIEDSALISFPNNGRNSLAQIIKSNPEVSKLLFTSSVNQFCEIYAGYSHLKNICNGLYANIRKYYETYLDLCSRNNAISRALPQLDELTPFEYESGEDDAWLSEYYISVKNFPQELKLNLSARPAYLNGFITKTSNDLHTYLSGCANMFDYLSEHAGIFIQDSGLDLFDLFASLSKRIDSKNPDYAKITGILEEMVVYIKELGIISDDVIDARFKEFRSVSQAAQAPVSDDGNASGDRLNPELKGSCDRILEYSAVDEEVASEFRTLLKAYKKLSDKDASDDATRKLRLDLTKVFYQVYTEAFQMSVRDYSIPTVLKMFFNFGYVDEELAGVENSNYLYSIADSYYGDTTNGIYTIYEWLHDIYTMRKDPSRNEFDTDYLTYLHEQKVQGKIAADVEARMANDPGQRVLFELENMFPMVNKVTFGRLSSFTPILSEHNIIKPLKSCILTPDILCEVLRKIEAVDYTAYNHETIYTNEGIGIAKEMIDVHILPNIILMPNIGTRGVMWQEIEGRKRTTPSRFMISAFHLEDVFLTLARLTGEYRWEMCKRVQGARWNDVSDKSLTSEYFDYIQFYRKNTELSADTKEKIKSSLVKAKNSFKEMFVRDYITWIVYESQGSPRLNKVVRTIMLTYCPFDKQLRVKLSANPLLGDIIEKYEIKIAQKLHHLENVIQKIKACGQEVPKELLEQKKIIEGTK